MKFKNKQFKSAIDHFYYGLDDEAEVEVIISDENIQASKLGSAITLIATYKKPPSQYASFVGDFYVTKTLEIFPAHENRPPRLTTQETQELVPKKST